MSECKYLALKLSELLLIAFGGTTTYKPTGETFNLEQLRKYLKDNDTSTNSSRQPYTTWE